MASTATVLREYCWYMSFSGSWDKLASNMKVTPFYRFHWDAWLCSWNNVLPLHERAMRLTGTYDPIDERVARSMSESRGTGQSGSAPMTKMPSVLYGLDPDHSPMFSLLHRVDEFDSSPWCYVWLIDLSGDDLPRSYLEAILSANEIDQAARFARHRDRVAFILCRAALRILLSAWLGISPLQIEIVAQRGEKPRLSGFDCLSFNISHADGLGAIAVLKGGEVGVDIEKVESFDLSHNLSDVVLTFFEREIYRGMKESSRTAFLAKCWTGKEALLKAAGAGLSIPMTNVAMPPPAFRFLNDSLWPPEVINANQRCWLATWRRYAFALVTLGDCAGFHLSGLLRIIPGQLSWRATFPDGVANTLDNGGNSFALDLFTLVEIEDLGEIECFLG